MKIVWVFIAAGALVSTSAFADVPQGFDTDAFAQFSSVSVPVGRVQDSSSLHSHGHSKYRQKKDNSFDQIIGIGLSANEMKNLGVESGEILSVEANNKKVAASVYKVTGEALPPTATVNLSVAAARKLGVREGSTVFIHHPGDVAMPQFTKKVDTVKFIGKFRRRE